MKDDYWEQFLNSGRIEAYLDYKNDQDSFTDSTNTQTERGETDACRFDCSDGDCDCRDSHW